MTPARFRECLQILYWPTTTVAEKLKCSAGTVLAWYHGREPIPDPVASWLEEISAAVLAIPAPQGWLEMIHEIDLPEFVDSKSPKRGWFGKQG